MSLQGLHHVTATVAGAQEDLDFSTGVLGLRLLKKTVNFDNHGVYHFYYGNGEGAPGTIWTTFPYQGKGVPAGTKGRGQITVTSFSVPPDSLGFWRSRLRGLGLNAEEVAPRFGDESLRVHDPSGLDIELVANRADRRPGWTGRGVPADAAVRGLHSVTLHSQLPDRTIELMTGLLGFKPVDDAGSRVRLALGTAEPGRLVEVLRSQDAPAARNGLGTVHHVAFAISGAKEQFRLREELIRQGLQVTEVLDRSYFQSIYFREPGGILFEVATIGPGFAIDEDAANLGQGLKLPPWEEKNRAAIEAALPKTTMLPSISAPG